MAKQNSTTTRQSTKKQVKEKRYSVHGVNFNDLYAVPANIAINANGSPRKGVYGVVTKHTPYICKPQRIDATTPPKVIRDMTGDVPKVVKNRMVAFWSDKNNKFKSSCYLVEKSIYLKARAANGQNQGGRKS